MVETALKITYMTGLIVGSVIRGIYTRGCRRRGFALERKSALDTALVILSSVGLLILPLVYVFSDWLRFVDYRLPSPVALAMGSLGAIVFALALWLLWRSHIDLGRNWSPLPVISEEQTLVTRGIYARIRHPMYAAHWLWGIAQALLLHNWLAGFAFLVCFAPFYFLRVPREEQMMLEWFGQQYRVYMSRSGRVFPRRH